MLAEILIGNGPCAGNLPDAASPADSQVGQNPDRELDSNRGHVQIRKGFHSLSESKRSNPLPDQDTLRSENLGEPDHGVRLRKSEQSLLDLHLLARIFGHGGRRIRGGNPIPPLSENEIRRGKHHRDSCLGKTAGEEDGVFHVYEPGPLGVILAKADSGNSGAEKDPDHPFRDQKIRGWLQKVQGYHLILSGVR